MPTAAILNQAQTRWYGAATVVDVGVTTILVQSLGVSVIVAGQLLRQVHLVGNINLMAWGQRRG